MSNHHHICISHDLKYWICSCEFKTEAAPTLVQVEPRHVSKRSQSLSWVVLQIIWISILYMFYRRGCCLFGCFPQEAFWINCTEDNNLKVLLVLIGFSSIHQEYGVTFSVWTISLWSEISVSGDQLWWLIKKQCGTQKKVSLTAPIHCSQLRGWTNHTHDIMMLTNCKS